jgi:hypothetical protein
MAIAGDPGTKGLRGKARTLKQAIDKNFVIDFRINADRAAHEDAPLEHQLPVAASHIQLAVANPRVSDNQFHCPLLQPRGRFSAICREQILVACRRAVPLHWTLILSNNTAWSV